MTTTTATNTTATGLAAYYRNIGAGPRTHAVVVCAYNDDRLADIVNTVRAVAAHSPEDLLVVVDHNHALHTRLIRALPGVSIVANQHEKGGVGTRRTGIALTDSDVVVFIDEWDPPRFGLLGGRPAGSGADRVAVAA